MTSQMLKVACLQMNAGPVIADNLDYVQRHIIMAADQGVQFIATPENTCHMKFPQRDKLLSSLREEDHDALPLFTSLAKQKGVWILLGSLSIKIADDKIANRSYLIDDQGQIAATYDKIHMFDVDLKGGESYRESEIVHAGDRAVLADTPWGKVGMTICYDLRFPQLYRTLAQAGASILTVPAAFTVPTGQAHWETLMRARAIENGAYVIAPAQCGTHDGGRKTYGHSLIVGPWGDIISQGGDAPGLVIADLDMDAVAQARRSIPSLHHDRIFEMDK